MIFFLFTLFVIVCYNYNGDGMKKIIISVVFVFYFILTILVTHTLLSYNKYNVAEFENSYLLTINDETEYKKSDLLLIKKNTNVKENDKVFYFATKKDPVKIDKVEKIDKENNTIVLSNELVITKDLILGNQAKVYPLLGTFHNILTSRLGYLLCIILPMLVALIYEIYEITKEIKKIKKK